jgi:thermostable 8-oxoguanine DNA glycosylase
MEIEIITKTGQKYNITNDEIKDFQEYVQNLVKTKWYCEMTFCANTEDISVIRRIK